MKTEKFYTYAHIRLDTGHVFYVGKGGGKRAFSKRGRNHYWNNIVNKYGYKINILEYFDEENKAYLREEQLIIWHKFFGDCEANISTGGSGGSNGLIPWNKGQPCSQETIDKISKKLTGIKMAPEIKQKISITGKGKKRSEKTKQKMSKSFKGRKFKEEAGINISIGRGCKPFNVYRAIGRKRHWEKGDYVGTWTVRSRCASDLSINSVVIGLCLRGLRKQHEGYIFQDVA